MADSGRKTEGGGQSRMRALALCRVGGAVKSSLTRSIFKHALFAVLGWSALAPSQAQSPTPVATAASTPVPTAMPTPAPVAAALAPAELFFRAPDIESTALSPSGRWLAMTTAIRGSRIGLVVFDLKEWKLERVAALFVDADVDDAGWVNDEQLIFSIGDRQRGGGDQRWWPGLFSVPRAGGPFRTLVKVDDPFLTSRTGPGREPLSPKHELLHVPSGGGNEVLIGEWRFNGVGDFTHINAKRLDVVTGRTVSVSQGVPPDARRWMFDASGAPRLVLTSKDGNETVRWREAAGDNWRVLAEFARYRAPFMPRFVGGDGELYVTMASGTAGVSQLHRFDFATGKPVPEPLVSTPGFDFQGRLVSESQSSRVLGVRVVTDAETTVWFDKRLGELQAQADQRWPGRINRIDCRRCEHDDMTAVVRSFSDTDPGQIWVYRQADTAWRKVGDVRAGVEPQRMATTDFARVKMRDGLEIPVWVTLPPGQAKQPRPAVVLVHGGPWVRGRHWGWDGDAQFLASRGYVVIEPEFRGSTGYGQKLFRAGWRQWGQAMQDDVADALGWAVGKGWVDADKVCIAGASYGGYATLMGLIRHPALYRCGVAWVAVTDPRLLFKWNSISDVSEEARQYDYPTLIGDPVKDAAMIDSVTPVLLADRIKVPVMLAFGLADRRVPIVHGERMRDALTAAGNPPLWVTYPDEGHGFFKLENRLDFMRRMEAFLARQLR